MWPLLTVFLFCSVVSFSGAQTQDSFEELTTSINGTILDSDVNPAAMIVSESGKYWCTFETLSATDEMRELVNMKVYENENLILTFNKIPGSDITLTNSGKLIFYNHKEHFNSRLKIFVYSKEGQFIFDKSFNGATQFAFSPSGETMGVRTPEGISIISLNTGNYYMIEKGLQLSIDLNNEVVVVALPKKLLVYKNAILLNSIKTDVELPRKVVSSAENNMVAVLDKFHLKIYYLDNQNLLFEDNVSGDLSFRDLKIIQNRIIAGIHKRNNKETVGFLRIYDLIGNRLSEKKGESRPLKEFQKINLKKSHSNYDPTPWPFFPFDSIRTVWNHYEQHMGSDYSTTYLHQGLDLITPIGEPTYSVIDGYVKTVLTIGGASYWRIAISDTQISEKSDGWLTAHLVESSIQFDIGDTVNVYDYLGDVINWGPTWGHIHFANISDSGLVWLYDDNEWGINFNPILALQPYPDTISPTIDTVFSWSKFAFALNESATYLTPDSLFGDIDIIVKVVDYVGDSEWQQPAYSTWYAIKRISDGEIIRPRTLGHILNHKYQFFASAHFQPYAGVIYQRDDILVPLHWNNTERNFYHNLTNSNGDSLVELSEKVLAFNTNDYPDGEYRIIVEVYDEAGNYDIDSMDVMFKNGNPMGVGVEEQVSSFELKQNYPNPFNPTTIIFYQIPEYCFVSLKVYDVLGNEIAVLVNEDELEGKYKIEFIGKNLSSGVYYYQLIAGDFIQTKKMILIK